MMRWFVGLTACTLTLSLPAEAQPTKDCPLRVAARLDMQTTPDGRVTIPVQVEGHDYRLMVDTGGYISTLSAQAVKQEGYQPQLSENQSRGMGTSLLDHHVTVKDFAVGRSHGKNLQFYVDDLSDPFTDGTLAPHILAAYDVDFDFAHDKLNLIFSDHCPGAAAYWTRSNVAVVPIEIRSNTQIRLPVAIDGKQIMALVDTGAHTSFISRRAVGRFLDIDEKDPALKSRGKVRVNGMDGEIANYPFQTLTFGNVTVNHPHIEIVENKVWNENELVLGIGILRQLHLYIAYKERNMYITPALQN